MAIFRRVISCHAILPALLIAFLLFPLSVNAQQEPTPDEAQLAADKKAAATEAAAKEAATMAAVKNLPE